MTGWIISWIIIGLITWPIVFLLLGWKTNSKCGEKEYDEIGKIWIENYFKSMFPNSTLYERSGILGILWAAICIVITWPFDRLAMYLHWRDACKLVGLQQERKGS